MDTLGSMEICNPMNPDLIQTYADIEFGDSTYLVVWSDEKITGSSYYVCAARVTPEGAVLDTGVCISSGTGVYEYYPKVAFDGARWLVVWPKSGTIQGRFVNTYGDPEGSVITIATGGAGGAAIAFDGTNYLVVYQAGTWPSYNIYGQRVSPTGGLIGSQILIAVDVGDTLRWPDIVCDGTNCLVVWMSGPNSPGPNFIHGQGVAPDGSLIGGNVQISDNSSTTRWWPMVAASDMNYCVVWGQGTSSDVYGNVDTGLLGIEEHKENACSGNYSGSTLFTGSLQLLRQEGYGIYDIAGRRVMHGDGKPGIYFLERAGRIVEKIVKVR
jgi:hypothetical protein